MPTSTRRPRAGRRTLRVALTTGAALTIGVAVAPWLGTGPAAAGKPRSPAETRLIRSHGNLPHLPHGTRKLAALAGDTKIRFDVSLAPRDPAALSAFITAVNTPGDPQYRHYLRPGQFGPLFGPSAETIAEVSQWLKPTGASRPTGRAVTDSSSR